MYHTRPVDERHEDSILLEELIEEACDIEKLNDGTQWKKYIAYACEFVEKMSKMEVE